MSGDESYARTVGELARLNDTIEMIEAEPPSPKRQFALDLLRETRARVIVALADLGASGADGGLP